LCEACGGMFILDDGVILDEHDSQDDCKTCPKGTTTLLRMLHIFFLVWV
jgi:hypothetical protein